MSMLILDDLWLFSFYFKRFRWKVIFTQQTYAVIPDLALIAASTAADIQVFSQFMMIPPVIP